MRVYIISYFGKGQSRPKRLEKHNIQVDWFLKKGLSVYIFAQEYQDTEKRKDVFYLDNNQDRLLFPSEARNVCLKHFYSSSETYAFFADNDCILYDQEHHMDGSRFFQELNPSNFPDLMSVRNPRFEPFQKYYQENSSLLEKNYVFNRRTAITGCFFGLRNLKKSYDKEIYFNENDFKENNKLIPCEDQEFFFRVVQEGFSYYVLENILMKEMCSTESTWTKKEDRVSENKRGLYIISKLLDIEYKEGSLNKKDFFKKYFKHSDKLLIEKKSGKIISDARLDFLE